MGDYRVGWGGWLRAFAGSFRCAAVAQAILPAVAQTSDLPGAVHQNAGLFMSLAANSFICASIWPSLVPSLLPGWWALAVWRAFQ